MWAAQFYRFNEPRRFISSLGLGAMGFGYPAALGAKVACPDKQVIDIDGDGSFLMNIQELATAHIEKIAAKAMILNNQHLGMVVQWEDRFYGSRARQHDSRRREQHRQPRQSGRALSRFREDRRRLRREGPPRDQEERAARRHPGDARLHDGPYVLDVVVPYTEHVLPMIPAGKSVKEMILK
jgi:acetolactate synthase-1/2/3 large subunit